jgi:Putative Flp pilus-assembly TadE/G-like
VSPKIEMHADARAHAQRGQILVLFTLGLVAMIAMVGLVLDGGDTFAQRRVEQNSADLAALAGANAYMNHVGTVAQKTSAAITAATAAADDNGYADGGGTSVNVSVALKSSGAEVAVDVTAPHPNNFTRVVGINSWDVSVTASAMTGAIDTAVGAAPWLMHINAFNGDGSPKYTQSNPIAFGEANGDYPISGTDLAWTDFNGNNNVNSSEVSGIIDGSNVVTATMEFGQYIGQHNQGNHTTLYGDVNSYLAGHDVPVPIVGPGNPDCPYGPPGHPDGCFKGWAMFHVISAAGGSSKSITGYFLPTGFVQQPLTVGECTAAMEAAGACGKIPDDLPFGQYFVRLSN